MAVTGERLVAGANGRGPSGHEGLIWFEYGRFLLCDKFRSRAVSFHSDVSLML